LSRFFEGVGSFRSGWQLFGICQYIGCSDIPIVFHIMIPAANLAHRTANRRSRWIPLDRLRQSACERDRISGIRRCAGRTRKGLSRLLKATSELERISDSAAVREAKDMLMALGDIRAYRAPRSGGSCVRYARQATPCFQRGCATKRRSADVVSVQMILSATTVRTGASGGADWSVPRWCSGAQLVPSG
jgi:hypothetical protein